MRSCVPCYGKENAPLTGAFSSMLWCRRFEGLHVNRFYNSVSCIWRFLTLKPAVDSKNRNGLYSCRLPMMSGENSQHLCVFFATINSSKSLNSVSGVPSKLQLSGVPPNKFPIGDSYDKKSKAIHRPTFTRRSFIGLEAESGRYFK